jgi:hypothetical protein
MWAILLFSLLIGAVCSFQQLNAWVLLPVSAMTSMIVVISAYKTGVEWTDGALDMFVTAAVLQFSYVVSGTLFTPRLPRPACLPNRQELIRVMQLAIAQELQAEFRSSQELPQQLLAVLSDLEARDTRTANSR